MVYSYEGANVTSDDIGGAGSELEVSVEMTVADDGTGWVWTTPWLADDDYTA